MKSYPTASLPVPPAEDIADTAPDSAQPLFNYQPEDRYGRQLLWRLIATILLAAITVLAGLSLIGFAPGADAHTDPSKQSTSATTLPGHER